MVVNKLNAIACRHLRNKISGFQMGCVESESPAMLQIAEDGVWYRGSSPREDQCSLCSLLSVFLRRPPLRRITKPTGRTFDIQDHRVRAAVR